LAIEKQKSVYWKSRLQGGTVKPPSLRKLLEATDAQTLLEQFARLTDRGVTLAVFDQQGQELASYPALKGDQLTQMAATVCHTGLPQVDNQCRALPILLEEQLVGALVGAPPSAHRLDKLLENLSLVISMLAAQAVERKSLAQELLDRYREINLLYRLHETIGAHIDLHKVAEHALAESVRIVKADGGTLFLCDEVTGELEFLTVVGGEPRLSESQGIPQWVAQEGRSTIVNDVSSDARHKSVDPNLRSLLCVPLKAQQKVLGVLCLCNKQEGHFFTAGDEKLLMALASPTAVAIENARQVAARELQLRQQIQELRIEVDQVRKRRAVTKIIDSEYFRRLAETAQQWREDLEQE
jgi:transcriptional regulator with GAF, ATPase, and Fis domain